jgi:uncharacterized protein (TIGR02453 family)
MDAHRKWYHSVRDEFIDWLDMLNGQLLQEYDDYYDTPGKKGINRINNNLLFHPNRPIYKDHFGAGLDKKPNTGDFYIEIGIEESMFAGGLWRPDSKRLASVRDAIDYNGEELKAILEKPSFKKTFGGLVEDVKLTRPPKGFSEDHPHIDLLKQKTFAVMVKFNNKALFQPNFNEKVFEIYREMLPFRAYLNQAISV